MDYYGDFSRCETQPRTNASTALMRANTTKQQRANSESTVEFFLWGVLVFTCAYATLRPNSEYFTEAYSIVRNGWNYTPFTNIRLNLIDLTATLCSIVMLAAIIALGLSGEAMRHAWATTARVADAHRRAKRSPLGDGETRRIMVSSDEFNYA